MSQQLPRLAALKHIVEVASHDGRSAPWSMRSGLYQGRAVGKGARDAYARELNATLVPDLAHAFGARIAALAGEPDKLYEYLKGYLMLAEPKRVVPEQMAVLSAIEWENQYPDQPQVRSELIGHLEALLADESLRPVAVDTSLVTRARALGSDSGLRERLGREARHYVSVDRTWDRLVTRYLPVYAGAA